VILIIFYFAGLQPDRNKKRPASFRETGLFIFLIFSDQKPVSLLGVIITRTPSSSTTATVTGETERILEVLDRIFHKISVCPDRVKVFLGDRSAVQKSAALEMV